MKNAHRKHPINVNYSIIIIVMKVCIWFISVELGTWLVVRTQSSVSFYIIYVKWSCYHGNGE